VGRAAGAAHPLTPPVILGSCPSSRRAVDDVDAALAAAERRGCEIVHPLTDEPWGVRRFFVRGPGGAVVNVLGHG
jgi:uncharacterized glyoxalase superfamily protein PhnB